MQHTSTKSALTATPPCRRRAAASSPRHSRHKLTNDGRTRRERPHPELHGVNEPSALVALVAAGLRVAAVGTRPLHEAVSQEALTVFTAQLLHHVLHQETVLVETPEDVLGYSARRTKYGSPRGQFMCTCMMSTWYKAALAG